MATPTARTISVLILTVIVGGLLVGCDNDEVAPNTPVIPDPVDPVFTVTPDTLHLTEAVVQATVELACDEAGLAWRIDGTPDWATVVPDTGTTTGSPALVVVTTQPDTLAPGSQTARLEVRGEAEAADVHLVLDVGMIRRLETSPDTLRIAVDTGFADLALSSTGNAGVSWTIIPGEPWLEVEPAVGFTGPGTERNVRATAQRGSMAPGSYLGSLEIRSNAEFDKIEVPVRLEVAATPRIAIEPESFEFHYLENETVVTVANWGNTPMTWSAEPDVDFLSVAPAGGTVGVGESAEVTVAVDRTAVIAGENEGTIEFRYGAGRVIRQNMVVMHFGYRYWALSHAVRDAEHCAVNDRIVTIPEVGNQLYRFRPYDGALDSVALDLPPQCVSIAPDGRQCVVGHDGSMTLIDLEAMQVLAVHEVFCDVYDIVMGGNGWVYCFPIDDPWPYIRCLDLATGLATPHQGAALRGATRARLHPGGSWIYGANTGVTPTDIEKHDISGGTAVYVDDSPYNGEYLISGKLWIADGGAHVFVNGGAVFHATDDPTTDMTYAGALTQALGFMGIATSSQEQRIYTLATTTAGSRVLQVYHGATFEYLGIGYLPGWPTRGPGGSVFTAPTIGSFVFARPAGAGAHVLLRRETDGPWAIASLMTRDLP